MKIKYKAIDENEKVITGYLEENSAEIAIKKLKSRGLKVVSVTENKSENTFKKTFKSEELPLLFRQIGSSLKSGIDLYMTFEILKRSSTGKNREFFNFVTSELKMGRSLSDVFKESQVFPDFVIQNIKIAEDSENLQETFFKLSDYLREMDEIKSEVKRALIYPIILIATSIIVINFLTIFVVPTFVNLYEIRDITLPLLTRVVVSVSGFVRDNFFILIIFTLLIIFLLYYYFGVKNRIIFDRFIARTKFGRIFYTERFLSSLNTLLDSSINPHEALKMVRDSMTNLYMIKIFDSSIHGIGSGLKIATSLRLENYFPSSLLEIIDASEDSSTLNEVVMEMNFHYKFLLKRSLKTMMSYLEPIIILILSVFVGTLVIAVALPMFNIVNLI